MPASSSTSEIAISVPGTWTDAIRIGIAIGVVNGTSARIVAVAPNGAFMIDSMNSSGAINGISAMNCTDWASCSLVTEAPTMAKIEAYRKNPSRK